jgi:hypothetical protein
MKVFVRSLAEFFVFHLFPKDKDGEWDSLSTCYLLSAILSAVFLAVLRDLAFAWLGMGSLFLAYNHRLRS